MDSPAIEEILKEGFLEKKEDGKWIKYFLELSKTGILFTFKEQPSNRKVLKIIVNIY